MTALDHLIKSLSKLPGVGAKSAARIAYYLLKSDNTYVSLLGEQIKEIKDKIIQCSVCGMYTEADPCAICSDPGRDRTLLCVVEQSQDAHTIESTREYNGCYHVLHGVIAPIEGVNPEDLTINELMERLKTGHISEVIIATNPTVEGDTTALYLAKQITEQGISVSRPALGLPVGGDLEYIDRLTLSKSLKGRIRL